MTNEQTKEIIISSQTKDIVSEWSVRTMPAVAPSTTTVGDEMNRALKCLYLEVDESIANDVRQKVLAALDETVAPFRAALRSLFCCECGRKFDQVDEWEECATHQRIRDLLRGETQ